MVWGRARAERATDRFETLREHVAIVDVGARVYERDKEAGGTLLETLFVDEGFGTLDELFEAVTLVQTQKVTSFPIVLLGSEYWGGLLDWVHAHSGGRTD